MRIKAIGGLFENQWKLERALESLSLRSSHRYAHTIISGAMPRYWTGRDPREGVAHAVQEMGLPHSQTAFYVNGILGGWLLLVIYDVDVTAYKDVQRVLGQQGGRFAR